MTELDTMLRQLAGDEPEPFDIAELRAKANRRRLRRKSVSAAAVGLILVAAAISLSQVGRRSQSVEAVDTAPVETEQDERTDDQGTEDEPADDRNTEDQNTEDQSTAKDGQVVFDTAMALGALEVVDEVLAALAAGEYEIVAEFWDPPPDENLPSEESQIVHLRQACGDGCRRSYQVAASRPADDGRYEVFFTGANNATFAVWATPPNGQAGWTIDWPNAMTDPDAGYWIDGLFGDEKPERITVARSSGFEVFEDDGTRWISLPGADVDQWVIDGWLHQEGRWLNIANQANTCDYSRIGEPVVPVSIFEWTENTWVTELATSPSAPGAERETVFWFCDAFYSVEDGDELHDLFEDGSGVQSINLFSEGRQLIFTTVASGLATSLHREDGTLLTDDSILLPSLDGPSETVGYATRGEGAEPSSVTVRSIDTGEITYQWSTEQSIRHFDYDGRFIVVLSDPAESIGPSQPDSERPFLDMERSGLLTVIDTTTGKIRDRPSPLSRIWLDCATNAPGTCGS